MARYTGPRCRLCRREGVKLFLKGERCLTDKCPFERRPYPPGQRRERVGKKTDYGIRLREKQKLKRIYGMSEKQFKRFFEEADRRKGITGDNLVILLERRLDNVVYRLGFASSRFQARQLVAHGHITVNGRKVDIPSYLVKVGDVIEVAEKSRDIPFIKENLEMTRKKGVPSWLELDPELPRGTVKDIPDPSQVQLPVTIQYVVEFYSR